MHVRFKIIRQRWLLQCSSLKFCTSVPKLRFLLGWQWGS